MTSFTVRNEKLLFQNYPQVVRETLSTRKTVYRSENQSQMYEISPLDATSHLIMKGQSSPYVCVTTHIVSYYYS